MKDSWQLKSMEVISIKTISSQFFFSDYIMAHVNDEKINSFEKKKVFNYNTNFGNMKIFIIDNLDIKEK